MNLETQEERREFIHKIKILTGKIKSNTLEVTGDDEIGKHVSADLFPHLFKEGHSQILPAIMIMENKETVEAIDIYNLLIMCHNTMTIKFGYEMWYDSELPEPTEFMRKVMSKGEL